MKRVLICDDAEINLLLLKKVLENQGYIVDGFLNPDTAYHKMLASCDGYYDIVVMDLFMQPTDGLMFLSLIRNSSLYFKDIKVIVLSGSNDPKDKESCINLGADLYLVKPVDYHKIGIYITELLN